MRMTMTEHSAVGQGSVQQGVQRGSGEAFGTPAVVPASARDVVNEMVEAGLLDDLMSKVDGGGLALTGEGGFLPEMIRAVLERGLQAELTEHLGYEKHER